MAQLVFLDGPDPGRTVDLIDGQRFGRLPACEVVVNHSSISRQHARVEVRPDGTWLVDMGSRNGLRVAGHKVPEVLVEDGLEFAVGGVEVRFVDPTEGADGVLEEDFDFEEPEPNAPRAADDGADEGGLALEDPAEIELAAAPAERRPGARSAPEPARPPVAPEPELQQRQERRADVLREVSHEPSGLLRGDLTQFPGWVQGLVWIGLLGLMGGLAWGAFVLVQGAKG